MWYLWFVGWVFLWYAGFPLTMHQLVKNLEVIFFVKKPKQLWTLNISAGLMCNSCQSCRLLIQNVTCGWTHFRYATYNSIYCYTFKLFILYIIWFPPSSSTFSSNMTLFWPVVLFIQHFESKTLIAITLYNWIGILPIKD